MTEFYQQVKERFIRYAKVDTQSQAGSPTAPSTMKQKDLGRILRDELISLGVTNVEMTKNCLVYGTIPSTLPDGGGVSVGFIAHMDTSPDASGTDVKPWVLEHYEGGDIVLNPEKQIVMEEAQYPMLKKYIGQDLILTDGTTLLGGDDKAAVAAIMTMVEYCCRHPELPHGPIQICFTPDEEVGRGTENFDTKRFNADLAYTLDGDALGGYVYETFNGVEAQLTIHGLSVHPGTAKGIMKNAVEIGGEFMAMLPALERPQFTSGREGYYHPFVFEGTVEKTFLRCLIRDHERERCEERKAYVTKCVEDLNRRYGEGTVELEYTNVYYSMREVVKKVPFMIDYLKQAMIDCGVEPFEIAMRGGTDGSWISQMGLPCPNMTAGYENAHGRFEFVAIQAMEKNVEILLRLVEIYSKHNDK
ncbi:MAG: peptidase T [Lachnospiraceae bacterium]|nr:peptidase T [Lachnospiraceae bacterium]